ncbi:hypothetical protein CMV_011162 [Castanea mollissima]|uniref:Reverse transcriptase zinc-binding domain-containing protein n=1 Tax=Castanea mollissima TaxID=60419 RepID=A0A8J4R4C1_9ROSI|nr:hypothetical protein CMV_011162 [Castanea mollissima]
MVACLMDSASGGWNNFLVDQYFFPFEAQRIKEILLCATRQEDCLTLSRTKGCDYSVKSGYQLMCEEARVEVASSSDVVATRNFWSWILKLKVPYKVRILLWKAYLDALPTLQNLKKRKFLEVSNCGFCSGFQESTLHAIWGCSVPRQV